ncbi:hypothetical protein C8C83_4384 [Flavobacterium sp. 90]|uniref:hypothetical protein n=1 Tax=unclassified Flavobacterium TaxID=196869 RepID=UPI000EB540E9|nr:MULTISPECIES: hypothetical protein [unclassified Flavobacterium]RKR05055.1 hypothetical protein C8C82_4723 [Flavobacterium sp. 81]TCK56371.1 hypothetical protein C8C83_4384 [Flavobacterium sp. 90]
METTIKRLHSENKIKRYFGSMALNDKTEIEFLSNPIVTNNTVFRKVIENYDYNLHISAQGQYVILLDREIEASSGIENDFFSGGTFLIGETVREVQKTKSIKTQVSPSFLIYKTLKSYAMPFLNWKRFIIDSSILDI